MKAKRSFTHLNYKLSEEELSRIDCTVVEADFNTNYPNLRRINAIAGDINRYLKHRERGKL